MLRVSNFGCGGRGCDGGVPRTESNRQLRSHRFFDVPLLQVVEERGGADWIFPKEVISERTHRRRCACVAVLGSGRHAKPFYGLELEQRR